MFFDYYLLHNLRNDQEIESFKKYWIIMYGKNKINTFYKNLEFTCGNTFPETEEAIRTYLSSTR